MNRRGALRTALGLLMDRGILDYYQLRGGRKQPWLLVAPGFERAYTTREAEAFVQGAALAAAVEAARPA